VKLKEQEFPVNGFSTAYIVAIGGICSLVTYCCHPKEPQDKNRDRKESFFREFGMPKVTSWKEARAAVRKVLTFLLNELDSADTAEDKQIIPTTREP
jgi:hypothetical protein